jgi:raffinose/stachyose/melibiose transport system permease protein
MSDTSVSRASQGRLLLVVLITAISIVPFIALVALALGLIGGSAVAASAAGSGWHALLGRFGAFGEAWRFSHLGRAIINSAVITAGAVAVVVALAGAAGYSLCRFPHRLNRLILATLLAAMMVPGIINTVALYTLMISIKGISTYWAMILVLACNALPFSVFLYANFIRTIPRDIEDAAVIDGCSRASLFWRITFRLVQPVTGAVVILQGLGFWNNYGQAVFFLQRQEMRTIPLAISLFFQQYGANWNLMAAAACIGMAPAVIAFLIFQRSFVSGITTGAVKA